MTHELLSKSQKKHQRDVAKAHAKHQRLITEASDGNSNALSVPSGMGRLAIVVSNAPDFRFVLEQADGTRALLNRDEQREAAMEAALRIRSERTSEHRYGSELHAHASEGMLKRLLHDREVTDIVLIGHGSISDLWLDNGGHFDWRRAAKVANHLKQGKIEQRMCGHFARDEHRNVPLGTFVVNDFTNVIAATGMKLAQRIPPDGAYSPVYVPDVDVIQQIEQLNIQFCGQNEPKSTR